MNLSTRSCRAKSRHVRILLDPASRLRSRRTEGRWRSCHLPQHLEGRIEHPLLFALIPQRGKGIGKALLAQLAKQCVANGWSRLQWSVLDWNTPSIDFYKSLGAVLMDEWTVCRVSGPALTALAQGTR